MGETVMCSVNNGLSGSAWNSLGEGCDREAGKPGCGEAGKLRKYVGRAGGQTVSG